MAKKSRKLSLKKETLRQLDESQLGQVAGGTWYYDAYNPDWVAIKNIGTISGGCTTDGALAYNVYYW